jgi:hypothetical protein
VGARSIASVIDDLLDHVQWRQDHPVNYLTIGVIMGSDTVSFNKLTLPGHVHQGLYGSGVFVVFAEEK